MLGANSVHSFLRWVLVYMWADALMLRGDFPLVDQTFSACFRNMVAQQANRLGKTRRQTSFFSKGKSQTRRVPSKVIPIAKTMAQCQWQ